jgi:hypothetical protein
MGRKVMTWNSSSFELPQCTIGWFAELFYLKKFKLKPWLFSNTFENLNNEYCTSNIEKYKEKEVAPKTPMNKMLKIEMVTIFCKTNLMVVPECHNAMMGQQHQHANDISWTRNLEFERQQLGQFVGNFNTRLNPQVLIVSNLFEVQW